MKDFTDNNTLSIQNVTKKYGNFTVLEDICLEMNNGVYGLLAPNGAGKTTLLNMLVTLSFPTSGVIQWNGKDLRDLGEQYRDVIGFLPQKFGYYKNNTPVEFLRYMATVKGLKNEAIEDVIEELLGTVALSEVKNKKMKTFSGGMLQRVGIAQALLNNPKILILDEPTAGLDPKERVRFRNMLRNLAGDRIVILSTHIVSDVETIADKIIMLKDHRLYCCDTWERVCTSLEGRVYEIPLGISPAEESILLYERRCQEGTVQRFFGERIPDQAKAVSPNLEDVFLVVYQDEEAL